MRLLVTGGAGFIGGNFIRYFLTQHPNSSIVNLDKPTYAGNLESLKDIEHQSNYTLVLGDIANVEDVETAFQGEIETVVHFAAESHVDRSILHPEQFVKTNVVGTQNLLEAARKHGVQKFIQVSTDEVYGTVGRMGAFTEQTPLQPNSPYSASKASADLMARAYYHTFQLPVVVTRCSNNYGPYQFPEKLIPLTIVRAMKGQRIPIYGDGLQVRDWLHVLDHVRALDLIIRDGLPGEVYNIGANNEWTNIDVVRCILRELGKSDELIQFIADRPGHDRRYAMDATKLQEELGWKAEIPFDQGLSQTVRWYVQHESWWSRVLSGEYKSYMAAQYGIRLDDAP